MLATMAEGVQFASTFAPSLALVEVADSQARLSLSEAKECLLHGDLLPCTLLVGPASHQASSDRPLATSYARSCYEFRSVGLLNA